MVRHNLKEDAKFFSFITTFERKTPDETVYRQWPYVLNNGVIMRFPSVYFYFIRHTYYANTGKRSIKVGFICWAGGIYAAIDIDFHVYPEKSVYVHPDKVWRLPYSEATYRVEICNANEHVNQNPASYVRTFAIALMSVIRLCVQYDVTEIHQSCYTHRMSAYPSYRLANLLIYQQKLVSKVRSFMILHCCCSFKTTAKIPYCGCETLCSETIPKQFVDAGHMCSDVLFCDSNK